jgi:hypothetical protein
MHLFSPIYVPYVPPGRDQYVRCWSHMTYRCPPTRSCHGKENLCHSSPSLHKLPYNNEVPAKRTWFLLHMFTIRPCEGLGIHWRLLFAKAAFSPMAIHVWFIVQTTAYKGALEYCVSGRKCLTIFSLHTILYIRKLSVPPITRGIARIGWKRHKSP